MDLVSVLSHWGVALVFVAVLVDLGGLPVPAAPLLVAAGALSVQGSVRGDVALAAAFVAAMFADHGWFVVGRRYGRRLLETVCRVSLSPDLCVSRTDTMIGRYGAAVLLFAKFVPGVSAVSIPTIAAMGVPYRRFLAFDAAGCLIWAGGYIGAGVLFSREIDRVFDTMSRIGGWSLVAALSAVALYVLAKLLHRRRLVRLHDLVRIGPEELVRLRDAGEDVVILDARSRVARSTDPRDFAGAIVLEDPRAIDALPKELRDKTVVTFCTCPNEASAAFVADLLIKAGYRSVRVLTGGEDALAVLSVTSA